MSEQKTTFKKGETNMKDQKEKREINQILEGFNTESLGFRTQEQGLEIFKKYLSEFFPENIVNSVTLDWQIVDNFPKIEWILDFHIGYFDCRYKAIFISTSQMSSYAKNISVF